MTSEEAYKKLISSVNIEYYIGVKGAELIKSACCAKKPDPEVKKKKIL